MTKLNIALFLENNIPFINETIKQLNKLNLADYEYTLSIYNMIDNLSQNDIVQNLTNHIKHIKFHNNITSIKSIMFEDINFKLKFPCQLDIKSNKPTKLYLHPKIYSRLYPMLEEEDSSDLLITSSDDIIYRIKPSIYNNNFIEKTSDILENALSRNIEILKNIALENAINDNVDYYIYIDNYAYINNESIISNLIDNIKESNADILTPKLNNAGGQPYANFWMKSKDNGEMEMSKYYIPFLQGRLKNIWDIEHLDNFYIIPKSTFSKLKPNLYTKLLSTKQNNSENKDLPTSIIFSLNLRELKLKMMVEGINDYGWSISTSNLNQVSADNILVKEREHPDLYQFIPNRMIWVRKYLTEKFNNYIEKNEKIDFYEPPECRDMYEWECFTDVFCSDLIDECEKHNGWSDGSNKDERIGGGYENVPTRDIHLKQIGLGDTWRLFITQFVSKVAGETFSGLATQDYYIAFVVRYTMDTQRELKPHHDSSVHSTVTCLNSDFEGGGTHFVRQNYTHNPKKHGLTTIHPGRCTHFHSGKAITSGKRYILVSFNT